MEVGFKHNKARTPEPVRIEQVFAEKPGGGLVANPDYDVPPTSAVGYDAATGLYKPIKCYKLVASVASSDTTIKIAKGSGVAKNDIIAHGKIGVKCTKVDDTNYSYDVVTVTLGVDINIESEDPWLYQSKVVSSAAVPASGDDPAVDAVDAEPLYKPEYITGNTDWVYAGEGDQSVKLINGANVRKETANISAEIEALLPTIKRV